MKSIRRGVFETNSSSTHSITMCSKEDFESWKKGLVIFYEYDNKFVPIGEAMKALKEESPEVDFEDNDDVEEALLELEYRTYKSFFSESGYETYTEKYKTKGGEEIIAFGNYGNDY